MGGKKESIGASSFKRGRLGSFDHRVNPDMSRSLPTKVGHLVGEAGGFGEGEVGKLDHQGGAAGGVRAAEGSP